MKVSLLTKCSKKQQTLGTAPDTLHPYNLQVSIEILQHDMLKQKDHHKQLGCFLFDREHKLRKRS